MWRRSPKSRRAKRGSAAAGVDALRDASALQWQYALATAVFAILVIGIIFLFGHLISRSLSKRYLEDVLIAGKEEAQRLAKNMSEGGGTDIYDVIEKRREVLDRSLTGLSHRLVFTKITVTDREGNVVYTVDQNSRETLPQEVVGQHLDVGSTLPDRSVRETQDSYQIPAPIGKVGEVILSVSKGRLAERVVRLRHELLKQTITVAVVTLLTLIGGFGFTWHLVQRTRRLEQQRREAEELAALGTLAANLAHEIRNPLNSINLNLEMLEEDLDSARDDARSSLFSTRREVGRLGRLVSDFLTYARPAETALQPVPLGALAAEVVEFLRAEARGEGVHLRLLSPDRDIRILGDEGQLRQVLMNLLLNAVQAVCGLSPDRRVVEVGVEGGEDEVSVVVRDRGTGVPDEELARVRRAFVTNRPGGTGLGLAIAERVAQGHGGRLELANRAPVGFEARLVLPMPAGDGKMSGRPTRTAGGGRGRKR
ncbi:MAG: hypothetical protein LJE95_16555 [Acidobacteria bacterium]|nr:hypothetical protein [Acidobacteriota bacterium]